MRWWQWPLFPDLHRNWTEDQDAERPGKNDDIMALRFQCHGQEAEVHTAASTVGMRNSGSVQMRNSLFDKGTTPPMSLTLPQVLWDNDLLIMVMIWYCRCVKHGGWYHAGLRYLSMWDRFYWLTYLKSRGVLESGIAGPILNGLALIVLMQHPDQIVPSLNGNICQHHPELSVACCEIGCLLLIENGPARKYSTDLVHAPGENWRSMTGQF